MKTKTLLFTLFLLTITGVISANEKIKGDGKVITQTVAIDNYDEISIAGQMELIYEQSASAPHLEITVDENIYPYVKIEVKGNKLSVGPKQDGNRNGSYNLQPTVYKIKTNSRELKKVNKAGSCSFKIVSTLNTSTLDINSAGSGDMELQKDITCDRIKVSLAGSGSVIAKAPLTIDQADISLAGSGNVRLKQLTADNMKLSLAGSGDMIADKIEAKTGNCSLSSSGKISVAGRVQKITYSVSGSGKINAFDCIAGEVNSSISGSGKIELYVTDNLTASVSGSGRIYHKGTASVQSKKSGSGFVKHVN